MAKKTTKKTTKKEKVVKKEVKKELSGANVTRIHDGLGWVRVWKCCEQDPCVC